MALAGKSPLAEPPTGEAMVQGDLGEPVAPARLARLTDPAVLQRLQQNMLAMKADPSRARSFLVEVGVITPKTGKLTKRFGG